jgi:Protein of unknown function (DUF1638)
MAYADCGTYGKLDDFCAAHDIPRLPGLHCYDLYAGQKVIAKLLEEEPGTYLLTDYLVRTFDRTVLTSLGLDKHPDLWPDYFGHYTRLAGVESALADLLSGIGPVSPRANSPGDVGASGEEACQI